MTPLELENRQLREALSRVTEERDALKREVQGRHDRLEIMLIEMAFGFTKTEARLVQALYSAVGYVQRWALHEAIYFDRSVIDYPEDKILDVLVCRIRKKMGSKSAIGNAWARGYELTESGRAALTERIEAIKARRAAA